MSTLGYDPTPGSPDRVRELAQVFGKIAENADEIRRTLFGLSGSTVDVVWQGQAAEAFRGTLEQTCADLAKVDLSHRMAQDALRAYADALAEAQAIARRAEQDAGNAVSDRDIAERRRAAAVSEENWHAREARTAAERRTMAEIGLSAARSSGDMPGAATQHQYVAQHDLRFRTAVADQAHAHRVAEAASASAAAAGQRLEAARRLANQARELREDAAHRAVIQVNRAADAGIRPRSFFEKAVDTFQETVTSREFDRFLDVLSVVGDVLSALAPVAVVACALVGAFGGPAGFAAGLALGVTLNRVLTGASIAVKGTVLAGRMAQYAVDGSQRDKVTSAAWDTIVTALPTKLFAGAPKGKPLTGGSGGVDILRDVKRLMSFDDNRHLSGLPRRYLQSVAVAPKAPAFGPISGKAIHGARVALGLGVLGADMTVAGCTGVEISTTFPDRDDSAWYDVASPEVVKEVGWDTGQAAVEGILGHRPGLGRSGGQ